VQAGRPAPSVRGGRPAPAGAPRVRRPPPPVGGWVRPGGPGAVPPGPYQHRPRRPGRVRTGRAAHVDTVPPRHDVGQAANQEPFARAIAPPTWPPGRRLPRQPRVRRPMLSAHTDYRPPHPHRATQARPLTPPTPP